MLARSMSSLLAAYILASPVASWATAKLLDPVLRPGLWEVAFTESTRKSFVSMQQNCVGPTEQETQLALRELEIARRSCEYADLVSSERKISYTRVCKKDIGVTVTARVTNEGNFSAAFTQTVRASFDVPTPLEGMTQTYKYTYRGACPKSMLPGDVLTKHSNGATMPKWNRYNPPQPASKKGNPPGATK